MAEEPKDSNQVLADIQKQEPQKKVQQIEEIVSRKGTRERKMTEKGLEEKMNILKRLQTPNIASMTKRKNKLVKLMNNENKLHKVKYELNKLNALSEEYKDAFSGYYEELTDEASKDYEQQQHRIKEQEIVQFVELSNAWIYQAECHLTDQMENHSDLSSSSLHSSSKRSSRSSKSSFSSRAKEKIRLAELVTERAILRQRQALQAAKEELELELEIAKSEARDKILNELDMQNRMQHSYHYGPQREGNLDQAIFKISDSLQSFIPPPAPSMKYYAELISGELTERATYLVPGKDEQIPGQTEPPIFTSTAIKNPLYESKLNPAAQPFHKPSNQTSRSTANKPASYNPTVVMEQSFQEVMEMQQQQNEQIIATHKQLARAMTLPQPIVPMFYGNPISCKTFILAFEARIHSRTSTNSDRLYYLTQHVEREPMELIEGCLYMDPDKGYAEARRLLDKEYGDPFKTSTAYIRKLTSWVPIRLDDPGALKRLSIFLTRCQNAL